MNVGYLDVMVRRILTATGALLALFHVWLFASQMADGHLTDAGLLLRWAVAIALVAGLWQLRRQGASLVWGRKAVSVWLLAAVLHGPALRDRVAAADSPTASDIAAVLVQVTSGLTIAAVLCAGILLAGVRPRQVALHPHLFLTPAGLNHPVSREPFAPRPPPLR
jgi:hypothetical protein